MIALDLFSGTVQKVGPFCLWGYFPPIEVTAQLAGYRKDTKRKRSAAARARIPDALSEAVYLAVSRYWSFPRLLDLRTMRRHRHVAARTGGRGAALRRGARPVVKALFALPLAPGKYLRFVGSCDRLPVRPFWDECFAYEDWLGTPSPRTLDFCRRRRIDVLFLIHVQRSARGQLLRERLEEIRHGVSTAAPR